MTRPRFVHLIALAALAAAPLGLSAANTHVKEPAPRRISHGRPVSLADYLVPGKTTVFEFYSPHCPDCVALEPQVEKLHKTRADLAVVMIDIDRPGAKRIDWKSPVAREFDLQETPWFIVFGPHGKVHAAGEKAYAMVTGWFR